MKNLNLVLTIIISTLFLLGCASNLPISSSLNDFVMMGINVNSSDGVRFIYESKITDGSIKPYTKDKQGVVTSPSGYIHTESSTLEKMLNEYFENKFTKLNQGNNVVIKVILDDFWIEEYSPESTGKILLKAFAGGETIINCVAKVKVLVIVNKNGEEYRRIINASSEDHFVQGIGTGTSTSNIYRGKESIEFIHARNINKANNKVIMMLNSYLEELGL